MTSKTLNVQGMSCDHCKMAVIRAVSALKAVSDVQVSLRDGTVSVSYDEALLPLEEIRKTIAGEGYRVAS